jgi:hypothetical protein
VSLFYGLLFSSEDNLPWDCPQDRGSVQLRADRAGVNVILGETSLGYLTADYARGVEAGQEINLKAGKRLKLFANPRQAEAWERWAKRQEERWEQGLSSLL